MRLTTLRQAHDVMPTTRPLRPASVASHLRRVQQESHGHGLTVAFLAFLTSCNVYTTETPRNRHKAQIGIIPNASPQNAFPDRSDRTRFIIPDIPGWGR